jgi:hypothetical protein
MERVAVTKAVRTNVQVATAGLEAVQVLNVVTTASWIMADTFMGVLPAADPEAMALAS